MALKKQAKGKEKKVKATRAAKAKGRALKASPKRRVAHKASKKGNLEAKENLQAGAVKGTGLAEIAKDVAVEEQLEDLEILLHPLVTEKAVNMIEAENKITFVVASKATKPMVRGAVESLYKVKVKKVNLQRDMKSRKRAIVTLAKEFRAGDVATKLGVI
ncbi:MAG TPA: 50S ribosomal protein L23 [Candidatus Diapherotrites archaeon]|uniref:Large ribosomal subunit protein uL23 n=1 Tax=Candidatus Iainarchaeum sp. TaxID=3101447 RepID=A0A7J4J4T3_9ARCH|nr:50S ribosomal protein L23 [Candidatus Diapherotrites archaeon]